jgi:hypothetical protein
MIPNEHLADQLRSAYDCYLEIQREVARLKREALKRDPNDELSALLCPPCFYCVEGEPSLIPRYLVSIDGNNSLKLVDSSYQYGNTRSDDRTLPSPRWLEPEQVDEFKDDVKRSDGRHKVSIPNLYIPNLFSPAC